MALVSSSSSSSSFYGCCATTTTTTANNSSSSSRRRFLSTLVLVLLQVVVVSMSLAGSSGQPSTDTEALTMFRRKADVHGILASNWSSSDACSGRWVGVVCSGRGGGRGGEAGRVTSLSLSSLNLRGPLDPLSSLSQLRSLDLHSNRLNGTLACIASSFPNLKLLYLSHNDLSGAIPSSLGMLRRLLRLDLSDNSLRGPIPPAFANLTRLLTLRLQNNLLSGAVPDLTLALPDLRELDVSNNELSGMIPQPMRSMFGDTPFAGNARLCAQLPPFPLCASSATAPSPSTSISSSSSSSSPSNEVVPSNPSSMPGTTTTPDQDHVLYDENGNGKGRLSLGAIIAIASGNAAILLLLSSLLLAYYCCFSRRAFEDDDDGDDEEEKAAAKSKSDDDKSIKYYNGYYHKQHSGRGVQGTDYDHIEDGGQPATSVVQNNKLVFFDGNGEDDDYDDYEDEDEDEEHCTSAVVETGRGRLMSSTRRRRSRYGNGSGPGRFELEELLRASAEMVGKGSLGTVYRAMLEDGWMVAVKRLRDANPCERRDFEGYMDLIGRSLHPHPNLVPLRAYYYAPQEKLLVYDYIPNGTLQTLLIHHHHHGGHGGGRALDWTTRVHLALGAARGLAHIHNASKIPHGNVTSSNVLIDANGNARLSDFGLALLLDPANATAKLGGYRAPEQQLTRTLSQEADLYAFGVLLLELLTGKDPNSQQQHHHLDKHYDDDVVVDTFTNLPDWVRSVVREEWTAEVFDIELLRYKDVEDEMVAMLHIALACAAKLPQHRPTMLEVVKIIADIRPSSSSAPAHTDDPDEHKDPRISSLSTTDDDRFLCLSSNLSPSL